MSSISKTEIPLIEATNKSLEGYGYLVDNFDKCEIEIEHGLKKGGGILKKGQEMKAEQLRVHLKHGGRKIFCMAKIML